MKIKMISKITVSEKTIITTEEKVFFWKKTRRFLAQREYPKGYWTWLELPNKTLVPDFLSFQLNEWNRI